MWQGSPQRLAPYNGLASVHSAVGERSLKIAVVLAVCFVVAVGFSAMDRAAGRGALNCQLAKMTLQPHPPEGRVVNNRCEQLSLVTVQDTHDDR